MADWKGDRKRSRDEYDVRGVHSRSKRGRYSDPGPRAREHESTEEMLDSLIVRAGEKVQNQAALEHNLAKLAEIICNELTDFKDKILKSVCRCACELSHNVSVYSTLIGILNSRKFDLGEELLDLLFEELKSALALSQHNKVCTLVRFLADLVNVKVVTASSIVALFDTFISVTYEPDIPQLRSDWYAYIVLSSLPWVAGELSSRKQVELDRLLSTIANYMGKRNISYLPAFQVWSLDRPHPQHDSLQLLWQQVLKMKAEGWKEGVLLRHHSSPDSVFGGAYAHPLHNVVVPNHDSKSSYPLPSVAFKCFGDEDLPAQTGYEFPPVDSINRFLTEELVRCTIESLSSNRKQCATQLILLAERLEHFPMHYIITEVLFNYILQLPHPPHPLVYYGSIFIEMCKLNPASFTVILTQTINLLFGHLDRMNFVAADRLAWWFSYHLSNFEYYWEWSSWLWCLRCPEDHPTRLFLKNIFSRCVRLATYDVFVEMVPEAMTFLLPSSPEPSFLYSDEEQSSSSLPETATAKRLVEAIRCKSSMEEIVGVLDSLNKDMPDLAPDSSELLQSKISVLTHCVLTVGEKTITHCLLALHKFRTLFMDLLEGEESRICCLNAVAQFYCNNPQLHVMVVDRMVKMQVVDSLSVIHWLFSPTVLPFFTSHFVWEILDNTISHVNKGLQQARKDLEKAREKVRSVSGLEELAGGVEEKQELEWQVQTTEGRVEEGERTQQEVFVSVAQQFTGALSQHLIQCDMEAVDYETSWFCCLIDNLRQLLLQNYAAVSQFSQTLEMNIFTSDVDSRILEAYQQFQVLL